MRKLSLAKIGLISASCLAVGSSTFSLSGCSQHTDNSISFYKKEFYVANRNISLPFTTTIQSGTLVHVDLINEETSAIDVIDSDFAIKSDSNTVDIVVGENVKTKKTFHFSLKFSFPNQPLEKITIANFIVHFSYHPEEEDGIRADFNNVINENDYVFNFAIQFQYKPQSNVKVELKKDVYQLLSLKSWGNDQQRPIYTIECEPQHREHWYYVDITVYLKVSIFSQVTVPFVFDFTFVNSKGREQKTTLDNLSVSLQSHGNDKVPKDFFKIETKSDGKQHLTGFKKYISANQIKPFPILEIPDSVQVVDSLGFKDDFFFDRIVLGKNVEEFRPKSLFNCNGMSMIDASKAVNVTKFITEDDKPVFNPSVFEHGGVVIVPNGEFIEEWKESFEQQGFKQEKDWEIYQEKLVVPDDQYNIQYDEKNNMYKLMGIGTAGTDLSQYAVIRMPIKVTNIDINAFSELIDQPYHGATENECRFLSISPMVDSFNSFSGTGTHTFFSGLNLRGLVNIPRKIQKLPEYCFSKITQDNAPHKLNIVFNKNSSVTQIGKDCFSYNYFTNISFPSNITIVDPNVIGWCTNISCLDFSSYKDKLPEWIDSSPKHETTPSYFEGVGTGVVSSINKGKILVSTNSPTDAEWQKWLGDHGLTNVESNWVIERV